MVLHKILLVDDDHIFRRALKNLLARSGFAVVGEAVNGWDAFCTYKTCQPDIVLMDISMPRYTGFDGLTWIMEYDRLAKVILMSGTASEKHERLACSLGSKGFIRKPFNTCMLLQMLNTLA